MDLSLFEIGVLVLLSGCAWRLLAPALRATFRVRKLDERLKQCEHAESSPAEDGFQLLKDSTSFLPVLRVTTELQRNALAQELARAGITASSAGEIYLLSRVLCGIVGGALAASAAMLYGMHGLVIVLALGCGTAGAFLLPEFVLRRWQKQRSHQVRRALPELLDLMGIAIEAGNSTDVAMREATQHLRGSTAILAQELATYFAQVELGRPRAEALRDLGLRNDDTDMKAFVSALAQTNRFGTDVSVALRRQAEQMRCTRRHEAEEHARQASFLLLFPLLIFIFPGVFVVLVGPAAIAIMRDVLALQ
jgi:tight adherence protein C